MHKTVQRNIKDGMGCLSVICPQRCYASNELKDKLKETIKLFMMSSARQEIKRKFLSESIKRMS